MATASCRFDKAASHLSNLFCQSSLKYFSLAGTIERSGAPYKGLQQRWTFTVLSNPYIPWGKTGQIAHVSSLAWQKTIFARHTAEATRGLGVLVLTHSIRPLLNSSQSRLPCSAVLATRCFMAFTAKLLPGARNLLDNLARLGIRASEWTNSRLRVLCPGYQCHLWWKLLPIGS